MSWLLDQLVSCSSNCSSCSSCSSSGMLLQSGQVGRSSVKEIRHALKDTTLDVLAP